MMIALMPPQSDLLVEAVHWTGRAGLIAFLWLFLRATPGRFSPPVARHEKTAVDLYALAMGIHLACLAAYWASGRIEAPLPRVLGGGLAYGLLMLGPLVYRRANTQGRWFSGFRAALLGYPMFVYLVTYVGRVQRFELASFEGTTSWIALVLVTIALGWRSLLELAARR